MRAIVVAVVAASLLLAGCAGTGDRNSPSPGSATSPTTTGTPPTTPTGPPPDIDEVDTDPAWPGAKLTAKLWNDGRTHKITARGSNEGSENYKVESNCGGPWKYTYEDPEGKSFSPRPGLSSCQEFSLTDFQPGAFRQSTIWWNETRWNSDIDEAEQVPPGDYTWTLKFTMYDEAGTERLDLAIPFKITVKS